MGGKPFCTTARDCAGKPGSRLFWRSWRRPLQVDGSPAHRPELGNRKELPSRQDHGLGKRKKWALQGTRDGARGWRLTTPKCSWIPQGAPTRPVLLLTSLDFSKRSRRAPREESTSRGAMPRCALWPRRGDRGPGPPLPRSPSRRSTVATPPGRPAAPRLAHWLGGEVTRAGGGQTRCGTWRWGPSPPSPPPPGRAAAPAKASPPLTAARPPRRGRLRVSLPPRSAERCPPAPGRGADELLSWSGFGALHHQTFHGHGGAKAPGRAAAARCWPATPRGLPPRDGQLRVSSRSAGRLVAALGR